MQPLPPVTHDIADWPEKFAQQYTTSGHWRDETFDQCFAEVATRHPQRTAVTEVNGEVTYEDLLYRVRCLANGLRHSGLVVGDNVVVHLPNGVEFVETCLALFQLGVRPVLALPAHRQHEIEGFCRFADAKAYICAPHADGFDPEPLALHLLHEKFCALAIVHGDATAPLIAAAALRKAPPLVESASRAQDVACFQLSGGTTGLPKLIPRRHREYLYNVRTCMELSGFNTETVYLAALPMAHNFTLCCPGVMGALLAGARVVASIQPDAQHCFTWIERERVTHTSLVPPLALLWMDAQRERRADLSSLRVLQVGGARLPDNAARRVMPTLGCQLQQVMGMAEGLICCTRLDDPQERVTSTQGRPISPSDEIRVVNSQGQEVACGEVGELQVRGPYTMRGYYRLPEHNAHAFTHDGFFRTGDRVSITAEGHVVVAGRDKDQINRGGEKVAAEEIENLLLAHPQVHDAAVVAMNDQLMGERICAFVVPREPAPTSMRLKLFLHSQGIAAFKIPDRIELIHAFPQTGIGKTSKKELRDQLRKSLEARL